MTKSKIKSIAAATLLAVLAISVTGCYYDRRNDRDYYGRRNDSRYDRNDQYNDRRDDGRWGRGRWDRDRERWRQEHDRD